MQAAKENHEQSDSKQSKHASSELITQQEIVTLFKGIESRFGRIERQQALFSHKIDSIQTRLSQMESFVHKQEISDNKHLIEESKDPAPVADPKPPINIAKPPTAADKGPVQAERITYKAEPSHLFTIESKPAPLNLAIYLSLCPGSRDVATTLLQSHGYYTE